MANPFDFIFRTNKEVGELEDIFPFSCTSEDFVSNDIQAIYTKILSDVIERTNGLDEKFFEPALWDSCLQSDANEGLITLLAKAMLNKAELYLVYKAGVLRKADQQEQQKIKSDYEKNAASKEGVYISFKNYRRTDRLRIYSALEYYTTAGIHKSVNVSKAVQIKIKGMRASVNVVDSQKAIDQAKNIAKSLKNGKDVMLDAEDMIETAQVDTSAVEKSIDFINMKKAEILAMPLAYVSGELTAGIGSTGESDMREIERGLKQYYEPIIKPVLKALFDAKTEFRSNDFRLLTSALDALRTFDMVSEDLMPDEVKVELVARLFDLDPKQLKKKIEEAKAAAEKLKQDNPPPRNTSQGTQPPPANAATSQGATGARGQEGVA